MFRNTFEFRDNQKPGTNATPDPFGRLGVDDDEPNTEIADTITPAKLKSSVGDAGQNRRRDVAKTEQLLGKAGAFDLKATGGPTGYWGTRTSDATKTFQEQNNLKVDGQINPGGETIRALSKLAGQAMKAVTKSQQPSTRHSGALGLLAGTGIGDPGTQAKMGPGVRRDDNVVVGARLPNLSNASSSENTRAARYLASQKGIGDFSTFVADGIETDGDKAIHETADLYRQTAQMNQDQADALIKRSCQNCHPTTPSVCNRRSCQPMMYKPAIPWTMAIYHRS